MKVAVIGSRKFNDQQLLNKILDEENLEYIISGGAKGADTLAANYARFNGIPLEEIKANWSDLTQPDAIIKSHPDGRKYDAYAGIRRNSQIIEAADKVIAFWDGTEEKSGTFDGIKKAKKLGKKIKIVKYLLL